MKNTNPFEIRSEEGDIPEIHLDTGMSGKTCCKPVEERWKIEDGKRHDHLLSHQLGYQKSGRH